MGFAMKFFVDGNLKVWSEDGKVKECKKYDEVLTFIENVADGEEWEMYRFTLNDKLQREFALTLKGNSPEEDDDWE